MIELNKIYNEDCLEGMKRIPDESVSLIVTDPPYLLDNMGGGVAYTIISGNVTNVLIPL